MLEQKTVKCKSCPNLVQRFVTREGGARCSECKASKHRKVAKIHREKRNSKN